jgi:ABC-type amino acid transport substrate-binding protein
MMSNHTTNKSSFSNRRKISLVSLLSVTFFFSIYAIGNEDTTAKVTSRLTFVSSNYRPWSLEENNQISGLIPDIVKSVAGEMGLTIKIQMVPHRRVYAVTSQGIAHLQVAFLHKDKKNPHYPKELLLGSEPLFVIKGVGVALKERGLTVSSLQEATPYRVGFLLVHPGVTNTVYASAQKQQTFHNTESLLKGLLQNRIDIALDTRSGIQEAARSLGVENQLHILYEYDSKLSPVIAWSRPALGSDVDEMSIRFDNTLRKLKQAGKIDQILQRYGLDRSDSH